MKIFQLCSCSYSFTWHSQPFIGHIPLGNIQLSAAILFSGSLPTSALKIFHNLRCAVISSRTFFRHQQQFLAPAVSLVWFNKQEVLLQQLREEKAPLMIGGDGRADSPGHSAKYGSYSVVDLVHNNVVEIQLV